MCEQWYPIGHAERARVRIHRFYATLASEQVNFCLIPEVISDWIDHAAF